MSGEDQEMPGGSGASCGGWRSVSAGLLLSALVALSQASGVLAGSAAPGPWADRRPTPLPVQEIYPVLHRGKLCIGGGLVPAAEQPGPSARVFCYDPAIGHWLDYPDLPLPLHHPYLLSIDRELWAIGGFRADGDGFWQMQSSVYALSPGALEWRTGPALPQPQAEFSAAVIDGVPVISGGREPAGRANGAYDDHVESSRTWALVDGAWQARAPLPTPRNSSATAVLQGRMHVIGGRQSRPVGNPVNVTAHEAYDPNTDTWQQLAPLPQAQGGFAAATWEGKIYAFGGEQFDPAARTFHETWVYDPDSDSWSAGPDLPFGLHGHGAVAMKDGIHVVGGGRKVAGGSTTDTHRHLLPVTR